MADIDDTKQRYESLDYIVLSGSEPLVLEAAVAQAVQYGFRPFGSMATTTDPRVLYQPMVRIGSLCDPVKPD